jgi:hypothetical protein
MNLKNIKKAFFFEKRSKKTFNSPAASTMPARSRIVSRAQELKVFLFFSSEKKTLPFPEMLLVNQGERYERLRWAEHRAG